MNASPVTYPCHDTSNMPSSVSPIPCPQDHNIHHMPGKNHSMVPKHNIPLALTPRQCLTQLTPITSKKSSHYYIMPVPSIPPCFPPLEPLQSNSPRGHGHYEGRDTPSKLLHPHPCHHHCLLHCQQHGPPPGEQCLVPNGAQCSVLCCQLLVSQQPAQGS